MDRHENTTIRILFAIGLGCLALLVTGVVVLFATQHRDAEAAPDYRVVRVGGIEYEAMQGRPIDPKNAVDAKIVAGLPESGRRVPAGEMLFGAFISATNDSSTPRATAERIALRDLSGRLFTPLSLPATNPYAYSQRTIEPGTRIPALGSTADANLAATGRLLLFRIPARDYEGGTLELVIHDPADPGSATSLII